MMKVLVDYPNEQEEFVIVERMTGTLLPVGTVVTTQQLVELQQEADKVYADPALMEYAVRLASATRRPADYGLADIARYILYGASPRASINLILTARALAFLRGRSYILVQDVQDMAFDVIRHRLVLSYEALSDNVTSDMLLARVMEQIGAPVQPLREHAIANVNA
jgi:MoxR-like ATPase